MPGSYSGAWWDKINAMAGVANSPGQAFFLEGNTGNDNNVGDIPTAPLRTFAAALAKCVAGRGDYIYVIDAWQDAWPVLINKTRVHIIGMSVNPSNPFVSLNAPADTAIFTLQAESNDAEIAGFNFGGGATHAGIENVGGTPMGVYIHDCQFGHIFAGNTPQDGIRIGLNATALRIEKCTFLGTTPGTITRDGIRFAGAGNSINGAIVNCLFNELPGVGINGVSNMSGFEILNNRFGYPVDNAGAAITLAANCHFNVITGNNANVGKAVAGGVLAYVDGAADNHWTNNYKALTAQLPA
ncbi:MAG: hypothetical protein PHI12_06945 [Dehalococcoidales bacterium]|nr:hypothetical protein [Dehalococcoidales bacterium]